MHLFPVGRLPGCRTYRENKRNKHQETSEMLIHISIIFNNRLQNYQKSADKSTLIANFAHYILRKMRIKPILMMCLLALLSISARAAFTPTAYYTVDGVDMEATDVINDAQAPLTVTFRATRPTSAMPHPHTSGASPAREAQTRSL